MSEQSFIIDVSDSNFQELVIAKSRDIPVLLDFWAPWCGPCKALGPALEKLATEYAGRFILAKLNVDENPQASMALRVQTVPTVYIFKDGQPVDGFQGAQPESALRALLDRHVPAPAVDALEVARQAFEAGKLEQAAEGFRAILEEKPDSGAARLGMARIALQAGDMGAAQGWVDGISEDNSEYFAAQKLKGVMGFHADGGNEQALRDRVERTSNDVEAWYSLGATLAIQNRLEEAMDAFLKVVELDRSFRDDAGRLALLSLFELVGNEDPAVLTCRRRLASLLF